MDRRDFLRQGLLTGAGLMLPAGYSPAQVLPERRKVVIIGQDLAEIWEGSFGQAGTHGIIQNYLRYDASLALTRQVHAERLTATAGALEKFFPGLGANYVKGFSKCWSEDIWSGGAWGLLAGKRLEDGRAPEGRIFFAGEHLSGHASWMQGALQSGLAAVEGIKAFRPVSRGAI